jgi:hypothetical protein
MAMAMSNVCITSTARMIAGDVVYGERMTNANVVTE